MADHTPAGKGAVRMSQGQACLPASKHEGDDPVEAAAEMSADPSVMVNVLCRPESDHTSYTPVLELDRLVTELGREDSEEDTQVPSSELRVPPGPIGEGLDVLLGVVAGAMLGAEPDVPDVKTRPSSVSRDTVLQAAAVQAAAEAGIARSGLQQHGMERQRHSPSQQQCSQEQQQLSLEQQQCVPSRSGSEGSRNLTDNLQHMGVVQPPPSPCFGRNKVAPLPPSGSEGSAVWADGVGKSVKGAGEGDYSLGPRSPSQLLHATSEAEEGTPPRVLSSRPSVKWAEGGGDGRSGILSDGEDTSAAGEREDGVSMQAPARSNSSRCSLLGGESAALRCGEGRDDGGRERCFEGRGGAG